MFQGGVGGGAIGVPICSAWPAGTPYRVAVPWWRGSAAACLFLTMIPIWALTVTSFGGPGLAVDTPRGLWVALYYWSLMVVLALACAIPHRPVIVPTASCGLACCRKSALPAHKGGQIAHSNIFPTLDDRIDEY